MKILLDTVAFVWILTGDERLSEKAKQLFQDPANEVYLSSVSAWEIAALVASGKLQVPEQPAEFLARRREGYGILTLPLEEEAACYMGRLPELHSDPFDRLLICQTIAHNMTLLSPDPQMSQYPVRVLW
jgi:PIN domain nuclease of toxin-antitoxin system